MTNLRHFVGARLLVGVWGIFWSFCAVAMADVPCYVAGKGGIYLLDLNSKSGAVESKGSVVDLKAPNFLAAHPGGNLLYCANNDGDRQSGETSHVLCFYRLPDSGELLQLSSAATFGATTAYLELNPEASVLLAPDYWAGTVAVFRVEPDGRIGRMTQLIEHDGSSVVRARQSEPHPHGARISPDGAHAYVPDLGTDEVFIYRVDAEKSTLSVAPQFAAKVQEGSGPRHFDISPSGKNAYLINELTNSVTVFDRDAKDGSLIAKQTISTLPAGFRGESYAAAIRVHPSGKFLYGSNRKQNSIAVFSIAADGALTLVEIEPAQGEIPSNFSISPDGKWLLVANTASNSVAVFTIDQSTGALEPTGDPIEVPGPRCLLFPTAE